MALTISEADVVNGGNFIEVNFIGAEGFAPISPGNDPTGFVFTIGGSPANPYSSALGEGNFPSSIRFFFDEAILFGQVVTLTTSGTVITDALSEPLVNVTNFTVVNNSLVVDVDPDTGTTWYYANQQDVTDAISAAGLQIASNMENQDTSTNTARIARAGAFADGIMNGRFRSLNFTIPLPLTDASDVQILKQISVAIVLVQLSRWRIITISDPTGVTNGRSVLTQFADKNQKYANDMMQDIAQGIILLTAPRTTNASGSSDECVPIIPGFGSEYWWGWGVGIPAF